MKLFWRSWNERLPSEGNCLQLPNMVIIFLSGTSTRFFFSYTTFQQESILLVLDFFDLLKCAVRFKVNWNFIHMKKKKEIMKWYIFSQKDIYKNMDEQKRVNKEEKNKKLSGKGKESWFSNPCVEEKEGKGYIISFRIHVEEYWTLLNWMSNPPRACLYKRKLLQ